MNSLVLIASFFRYTLIIFLGCIVVATTTPVAQAQNYDVTKKILEADKQVRDYQEAKVGGYGYIYDGPGAWDTIFKVIVVIVLLGALFFWFRDLKKQHKVAIVLIVLILIGIINLSFLNQDKRVAQAEEEKNKEIALRETAIEAYKTVFKENVEPIKRIFNGDDPRFLAGEKSFEKLENMGMKPRKMFYSKYNTLQCHTSPCIGMIFPKDHPITAGISAINFYYCKTKENEKILTGFGLDYNPKYEPINRKQYYAVRNGLLDAGLIAAPYIAVSKDRKMTYMDSPDYGDLNEPDILGKGDGLSVVWSKASDKNGKDLCGNSSFSMR